MATRIIPSIKREAEREMECVMKVRIEIEMPKYPNFLRPVANKEALIDVADLDDDELEEFIEAWSDGFFEHVKERRNAKAKQSQ